MKTSPKVVALLLVCALCVSMVACGGGPDSARDYTDNPEGYVSDVSLALISLASAADTVGSYVASYPNISSEREVWFSNSVEILERLESDWSSCQPPAEVTVIHEEWVSVLAALATGARDV